MERALTIARIQLQRSRIDDNAPPVVEGIMEPLAAAIIMEPLVVAAIGEPPSTTINVEPLAIADIEEMAMAYVIEKILEDPLQETSELFTVPENWDPPSDFRMGTPLHGPENHHGMETMVPPEEGFTWHLRTQAQSELG